MKIDAQAEREEAEYVASLMPNARVHLLQGRSGLQIEAQMAIMRELAGIEQRPEISTVLAAVLFTDIVNSTQKQAELGDRRWSELVLAHHSAVRGALSDWGGTEHDTAGDGFFASFMGPARAIHCAHDIAASVAGLGIETRAAVHIGECEVIDGKPGGLAATIGARLLGAAGAREVVVSRTVKDLVAGSGFSFTDRGSASSKACRTSGGCTSRNPCRLPRSVAPPVARCSSGEADWRGYVAGISKSPAIVLNEHGEIVFLRNHS